MKTLHCVSTLWVAAFVACCCGALTQEAGTAAGGKPQPSTGAAVVIGKTTLLPCNLSFQIWNGLLTVDTIMGKAGLQRFAIDPGLDGCTLTPRAAQLITAAPTADQARITVFDQAHTAPLAHVPMIQINAIKLERLPVAMIDVLALLSPNSARRPDAPTGWLGASFLSAFQVTLSFDERYVLLERPDAPLPKGKGTISVPIQIQDGRVMMKLAIPGARPFMALLSTCSPITMIPTAVAQQAKLKALETLTIGQPGGKAGKVGRVVLPKLNLGRATLEGVNAVFVAPDAPPELSRNLAMIGTDLMRRYKVTISYTRHVMILTPPTPPGPVKKEGDDEDGETKTPPKRSRSGH